MTNEERIRSMTHDELYNFLNTIAQDGPWYNEFNNELCKYCEPIGQNDEEDDVLRCELSMDNCPYENGDVLKWWLKQTVKGENK